VEQILDWPDSIDRERKAFMPDEARRTGRWIATNSNGTSSGYHMSHLICPWVTAAEIIADSERGEEYFHNFCLGEPYTPSVLVINRTLLLKTGKWYLGVDVGSIKHYVLGSDLGITQMGRFADWSELDELIMAYDPITVIDAMPENEVSRSLVANNPKISMCYLGRDKESNAIVRQGKGEERGIIKADRNRLIDFVIARLRQGEILMNVPADATYRLFLKHCENMRKVKEVDSRGIERYVWESRTTEDHLFFSLMFYELARMELSADGAIISEHHERPEPIVRTEDGFMLNLEEALSYEE